VSQTFVQLSPELEHACRDAVVLTSTERLRRNLRLAYDEHQQLKGLRAWATPRVRTLDGYLMARYMTMRQDDPSLPGLLSPEAEYQLFQATAPANAERLVPMAQQAWTLARHWQVALTAANLAGTENGRIFLDWSERIRRRLQSQNAITRADLPMQDLAAGDERLCLLAFENLPAAYEDWINRQRSHGRTMEFLESPPVSADSIHRTTFESPRQELTAVAQWARNLLIDAEDVRIGIVIPDLGSRYTAVVRQFTAEFDPLLETGMDGLVDVGGGAPLGEQPVWQAASAFLKLAFDTVEVGAVLHCLNSTYLDLPPIEKLPDNIPARVNLAALMPGNPGLRTLLESQTTRPDQSAPPGRWLQALLEVLDRAGWTGRHTGSTQYQAHAEIRKRIEALSRTGDGRTVAPLASLNLIDQYLSTIVFAPQRSPAPIQIMGYLETTGLNFDHLWICGLDDQSWPQPLHLNPFIPISIRHRHGIPRSTPEQETAFARERINHWQTSAAQLILSHALDSGETRLRPSPLIRPFPEIADLTLHPARAHPGFVHEHSHLETIEDRTGSPTAAGHHRGGTGLIRNQALCPFRGFAIHRLGLKEERPIHGLPDALDRGTLVHEALHCLYDPVQSGAVSRQDLSEEDFSRAADQALHAHYQRFPARFKARERDRLIVLLGAWHRLESADYSETIEALEEEINAEFDEIGLRLRVDRMDRIGEALVVIDYKTGRIGSGLNQDRLIDPQLPLYALCNEAVEGVLYAEVREDRPRLKGISALDIGGAALTPPVGGSWEEQRKRWQDQVQTLTGEIREGWAAVSPYDDRACQTCHLKSFCRIDLEVGNVDGEDE